MRFLPSTTHAQDGTQPFDQGPSSYYTNRSEEHHISATLTISSPNSQFYHFYHAQRQHHHNHPYSPARKLPLTEQKFSSLHIQPYSANVYLNNLHNNLLSHPESECKKYLCSLYNYQLATSRILQHDSPTTLLITCKFHLFYGPNTKVFLSTLRQYIPSRDMTQLLLDLQKTDWKYCGVTNKTTIKNITVIISSLLPSTFSTQPLPSPPFSNNNKLKDHGLHDYTQNTIATTSSDTITQTDCGTNNHTPKADFNNKDTISPIPSSNTTPSPSTRQISSSSTTKMHPTLLLRKRLSQEAPSGTKTTQTPKNISLCSPSSILNTSTIPQNLPTKLTPSVSLTEASTPLEEHYTNNNDTNLIDTDPKAHKKTTTTNLNNPTSSNLLMSNNLNTNTSPTTSSSGKTS